MLGKAPIFKLSLSKAPKRSKLAITYRHTTKTSGLFNNNTRAPTLALAIIFKTPVPLQKFPFLVRHTNPRMQSLCGCLQSYLPTIQIELSDKTGQIHFTDSISSIDSNSES